MHHPGSTHTNSSHAAASAVDVDVDQAHTQLGRQVGCTTRLEDVSPWFVRAGVLLALLGAVLSVAWTDRLL